jgi:hypothetical protein
MSRGGANCQFARHKLLGRYRFSRGPAGAGNETSPNLRATWGGSVLLLGGGGFFLFLLFLVLILAFALFLVCHRNSFPDWTCRKNVDFLPSSCGQNPALHPSAEIIPEGGCLSAKNNPAAGRGLR